MSTQPPSGRPIWEPPHPPEPPAAPDASSSPSTPLGKHPLVRLGLGALAFIGFMLSQQDVSLLTGSGTVWMGFTLTAVAAAAGFVIPATPRWLRALLILAVIISFGSAVHDELWLQHQRQKISQLLSGLETNG